ncbi:hypothetical protein ACVWXM_007968 [Bradyrhizobium sp. GM7.3]
MDAVVAMNLKDLPATPPLAAAAEVILIARSEPSS